MKKKVVIIGGGFAGLYVARGLSGKQVDVTLIDKRNFHLFQPLLYQVATGGLSPGDIASPIRSVLHKAKNVRVICATFEGLNADEQFVMAGGIKYVYDELIIATGVRHHYFGNDSWGKIAPGLKTVEDALDMRQRIMRAFEEAEKEADEKKRQAWLRFVIVGGGPTGVELAGALGELAYQTLVEDFRAINPRKTEIYLLEAAPRILTPFSEKLSAKAAQVLNGMCVRVLTNTQVTGVDENCVRIKNAGGESHIESRNVFWAAGVKATSVSNIIERATKVERDRSGRIMINKHLQIDAYPSIRVLGDLAHFPQDDKPLPGVAQVAMQQGKYVAASLVRGSEGPGFRYKDKGSLAVIGRKAAVAQIGRFSFSGWPAWLIWVFVHILYLIEFDSKLRIMMQWAWNFFTKKRGARLITKIRIDDSPHN